MGKPKKGSTPKLNPDKKWEDLSLKQRLYVLDTVYDKYLHYRIHNASKDLKAGGKLYFILWKTMQLRLHIPRNQKTFSKVVSSFDKAESFYLKQNVSKKRLIKGVFLSFF